MALGESQVQHRFQRKELLRLSPDEQAQLDIASNPASLNNIAPSEEVSGGR